MGRGGSWPGWGSSCRGTELHRVPPRLAVQLPRAKLPCAGSVVGPGAGSREPIPEVGRGVWVSSCGDEPRAEPPAQGGWGALHPGGAAAKGPVGCPLSERRPRLLPGARGHAPSLAGATMAVRALGLGHTVGEQEGWGRGHGAPWAGLVYCGGRGFLVARGRTPVGAAAAGAAEGPAAPRGARGWRERVSSDLSSAGRKEGRKRGRPELHGRFLLPAARCVAGKPGQGSLLPSSPSHPSARRAAMGVPRGDVPAAQRGSPPRPMALQCPRAGPAGPPSQAGTGRGSRAMYCAGGPAGGLKITRCECPAGLGPGPRPAHNRRKRAGFEHCFATDARFLCPAAGTLLSPAQRGRGAGGRPPPAPGKVRVARAQVAVPRLPLCAWARTALPGSLLSAVEWGGGSAVQDPLPCGRLLLTLLSLCPLRPRRCPRPACRQRMGMGRGDPAARGAARPSHWRAIAGSPWGSPCPADACARRYATTWSAGS